MILECIFMKKKYFRMYPHVEKAEMIIGYILRRKIQNKLC